MKNHCSANKITHLLNIQLLNSSRGATSCFLLESKLSTTANSLEVKLNENPISSRTSHLWRVLYLQRHQSFQAAQRIGTVCRREKSSPAGCRSDSDGRGHDFG